MTSSCARLFFLVLCAIVANAASDDCQCVDWATVHADGVPDGSGWEVISRVGNSIYRGLDMNKCMLKTTRCMDENWDSDVNTPEDTWCFVHNTCTEHEGEIADTNYAWKTCAPDEDLDFCSLTIQELVDTLPKAALYGVTDPTKFIAWACPYSKDFTLNAIAAQTGSSHMVGCGFNSENAPNITTIQTAQAIVDESGCSTGDNDENGFTGIVEYPGSESGTSDFPPPSSVDVPESDTSVFSPPSSIDADIAGPSLGPGPRKAALIQQGKIHIDDVHNAVGKERTKLLTKIDTTIPLRVVAAGMSQLVADVPDACAIPHSLYLVGQGMIYFCSSTGPQNCTCEYGCDL